MTEEGNDRARSNVTSANHANDRVIRYDGGEFQDPL
jgi:hypothetical protein